MAGSKARLHLKELKKERETASRGFYYLMISDAGQQTEKTPGLQRPVEDG